MKEVTIPESLYHYLEEKYKDVEIQIVRFLLKNVDSKEKKKLAVEISEEYLKQGDELKGRGDLVNAGEAYWKALALLMETIAENAGFEISSYQDYFSLIDFLAYKTNDGELVVDFTNAERLHGEFHPRPQEGKSFEIREQHAKQLIQRLIKYL